MQSLPEVAKCSEYFAVGRAAGLRAGLWTKVGEDSSIIVQSQVGGAAIGRVLLPGLAANSVVAIGFTFVLLRGITN